MGVINKTMPTKKNTTTKKVEQKETQPEFVTKADFDEKFGQLLGLVEKVLEPKTNEEVKEKSEVSEAQREVQTNKTPIPPEWNFYIDEHLGKQVGRSVFYPKSGTGFLLQLSIPKEMSNATQTHWSYYHNDLRTKAIDPREGFEGVKRYVDLVARNLGLDPRTVAISNNKLEQ